MKKILKIWLFLLITFLLISTTCFASSTSSKGLTMSIVENNVCTIPMKETAVFEKKIIDSDLSKKEITIQMKISNIAEEPLAEPSEIILVIDTSHSMTNEVSENVTRLAAVKSAATKLSTELLKNENVKMGIVSFSTYSPVGSISDAKLETPLTNSLDTISSTIDNITFTNGGSTNIDAGLTLAGQNFSETCENKYIILLTDGIPNYSIGVPHFEFSGITATNTKATLERLSSTENINIISVMIGLDPTTVNPETNLTYKYLSEEVFGTPENPTCGKYYYITDTNIEKTIATDILNDLTKDEDGTLTNIDIYDYFPQEIIDNFDFEYVATPNLGNISPSIDLQNNCIVWHIDSLNYGEVGTVSYKLKVKENVDSSILNVILNTNKKVEIDAKELDNPVSSTVSPKIKLSGDTTVAKTVIPQTGISNSIIIGISAIAVIGLGIGIRLYILNKNTK